MFSTSVYQVLHCSGSVWLKTSSKAYGLYSESLEILFYIRWFIWLGMHTVKSVSDNTISSTKPDVVNSQDLMDKVADSVKELDIQITKLSLAKLNLMTYLNGWRSWIRSVKQLLYLFLQKSLILSGQFPTQEWHLTWILCENIWIAFYRYYLIKTTSNTSTSTIC